MQAYRNLLIALLCLVGYTSCSKPQKFSILAINDVYNIEGVDAQQSGGLARLRSLRRELSEDNQPLLLLHAGDFLFPSSMSDLYAGEQMIDVMNVLDGDSKAFDSHLFVTFGNHEFDQKKQEDAAILHQRMEESDFSWLASNISLDKKAFPQSPGFSQSLKQNALLTINGIRVGLYSLTTAITTPAYASIDEDYIAVAKRHITDLKRKGAQVIIALTHLPMSEDKRIIEELGEEGPHITFGGHEHNRQYLYVGKKCIIKADADIRSATLAEISLSSRGQVRVKHRYLFVNDNTTQADPLVQTQTQQWIDRYESDYCKKNKKPADCLQKTIGRCDVELIGEELEIRRYETNLGSFVAEQMMKAFDTIPLSGGKKVQIALINSGSLRLNQNIPANTDLNAWYLNALFQYPIAIRLLEINGRELREALEHSIEKWTGNGWWLQSAGIAYRHHIDTQSISELHLVDAQGKLSLVQENDSILVAVADYIANPSSGNQDGYTMFHLNQELIYDTQLIDLKSTVQKHISSQWLQGKGISPQLPGRVWSSDRPSLPTVLD